MRHNEEYGAFRRRLEDSSDLDPDFDIAIRDQKRSYAEDLQIQIEKRNARRANEPQDQVHDLLGDVEAYEHIQRHKKDD